MLDDKRPFKVVYVVIGNVLTLDEDVEYDGNVSWVLLMVANR